MWAGSFPGPSLDSFLLQALDKMEKEWSTILFNVMPYKETETYILKSPDEASQLLDDHIVMTQSMTFSPYKKPFEQRINSWENKLKLTQVGPSCPPLPHPPTLAAPCPKAALYGVWVGLEVLECLAEGLHSSWLSASPLTKRRGTRMALSVSGSAAGAGNSERAGGASVWSKAAAEEGCESCQQTPKVMPRLGTARTSSLRTFWAGHHKALRLLKVPSYLALSFSLAASHLELAWGKRARALGTAALWGSQGQWPALSAEP